MFAKCIRFLFVLFVGIITVPVFCASEKRVLPIQTWVTSSGTNVFYVYTPELPMVDIQVVFSAGSAYDEKKAGLAQMTNDLLNEGTRHQNADQIAAAFDEVGAIFTDAINRDMALVGIRSLSDPKFLNPALKMLKEVLATPTFPDVAFKRMRKQTLNALTQQDELPASIAEKMFYKNLYGTHPYGHSSLGTIESVSKLTRNDILNFYRRFYVSKNAIVVIVGDVKIDNAKEIAETLMSGLSTGNSYHVDPYDGKNSKESFQHFSFPSTQTHVIIGELGITRKDPDYFSLTVGNYILGGGSLTSRLFDQVREKRGLAYSVNSQFVPMQEKGPFIVELQTRNDEVNNAIKIVQQTLENYIMQGPTSDELNLAKKNIIRGFALRFVSNSAIVANVINIGFYQLPLTFLDTYKEKINAVTLQQIKSSFQNHLKADKLITVTVGNSSHLNAKK